jgi:hypothetical protein
MSGSDEAAAQADRARLQGSQRDSKMIVRSDQPRVRERKEHRI